jgi:hypothetical protein
MTDLKILDPLFTAICQDRCPTQEALRPAAIPVSTRVAAPVSTRVTIPASTGVTLSQRSRWQRGNCHGDGRNARETSTGGGSHTQKMPARGIAWQLWIFRG